MKKNVFSQWNLILREAKSFCLALLLLFPLQTAFAVSPTKNSSTLDQLLLPGANLMSPEGGVEFSDFSLAVDMPDLHAPDGNEIEVEIITPAGTDETVLQFRILGTSQILRESEAYQMQIDYQAQSISSEVAFSEVVLDIDGATLGTSGDGIVQVHTDVFSAETPVAIQETAVIIPDIIAQLGVVDDGDGNQGLIDSTMIQPPQLNLYLHTVIDVRGGNRSGSGAVFTDWQMSFLRSEIVPEPSTILLAISFIILMPLITRPR